MFYMAGCSKKRFLKTSYFCVAGNSAIGHNTVNTEKMYIGSTPVSYMTKGTSTIYDMNTAYFGTTSGIPSFSAGTTTSQSVSSNYSIFSYAYYGNGGSSRNLSWSPSTFTPSKNQSIHSVTKSFTLSQKDTCCKIVSGSKTNSTPTVNTYTLYYSQTGISVSTSFGSSVWIPNPISGNSSCYTNYLAYPFNNSSIISSKVHTSFSVSSTPTTSPAAASTFKNYGLATNYVSYSVSGQTITISPKYNAVSSQTTIYLYAHYSYTYGVTAGGAVENTVSDKSNTVTLYYSTYKILFVNSYHTGVYNSATFGFAFEYSNNYYNGCNTYYSDPYEWWSNMSRSSNNLGNNYSGSSNSSFWNSVNCPANGERATWWCWVPKNVSITHLAIKMYWPASNTTFYWHGTTNITQVYTENGNNQGYHGYIIGVNGASWKDGISIEFT